MATLGEAQKGCGQTTYGSVQYGADSYRTKESLSKTEQATLLLKLLYRITGNDGTDSESKAEENVYDLIETQTISKKIWEQRRVTTEEIDALKRKIVTETELLKTQSQIPVKEMLWCGWTR